ncbi:MAG: phenylalanine--tRNA ligase subunit alpha, partial [Bacteroidetes bacterium]
MMLQKISDLQKEISSLKVKTPGELESFRLKYLSKKGLISDLFEDFRNVAVSEKKEVGQKLNLLKQNALEKYNSLKAELLTIEDKSEATDLTRPAFPFSSGSRHPISVVRNEMIDIFSRIGFTVSEGPEIEDDDHVFTKLNFAPEHPARDMQDTFYISRISPEDSCPEDILLRT